jgi:hypothetical protein
VILLAAIGVGAAVARLLFLDDLLTVGDGYRQRFLLELGIRDPFAAERPAEISWFDSRFAAHPTLTVVHVGLGGVVLVLAPLQLVARIRQRFVQFHRWSGRLVILSSFIVVASALPFGVGMPFGGWAEATATSVVGSVCLFAMARAFVAIRRRDVDRHREWMVRGFAALIGISTIRVVGAGLDLVLTPLGVPPRAVFGMSLWLGWSVTGLVAELWIRRTRWEAAMQTLAGTVKQP